MKYNPEPSEQGDLMNPFSVSLENMEEGGKNTCTLQSWAKYIKYLFLCWTQVGVNGEFQTHAHSLTLPSSPASLPSPVHSLPPLPKRKDQALSPSDPHICLAGEHVKVTAKTRVSVLTHNMKQSMCHKPVPAASAALEVKEASAHYSGEL